MLVTRCWILDAGYSKLDTGLWVLETIWYTGSFIRTVVAVIANYEGLEGSIIDNSVANSRIGVLSKNIKKTIDRQPQNHCTQDKDKYQLIGAEFLHHIGLRDTGCGLTVIDSTFLAAGS
jgi:hypothetical protein